MGHQTPPPHCFICLFFQIITVVDNNFGIFQLYLNGAEFWICFSRFIVCELYCTKFGSITQPKYTLLERRKSPTIKKNVGTERNPYFFRDASDRSVFQILLLFQNIRAR